MGLNLQMQMVALETQALGRPAPLTPSYTTHIRYPKNPALTACCGCAKQREDIEANCRYEGIELGQLAPFCFQKILSFNISFTPCVIELSTVRRSLSIS